MNGLSQNAINVLVICFMALPAVGGLVLYRFTENPYLRPLGISEESVAEVEGQTEAISIDVRIDYGADRIKPPTQAELRRLLSDALSVRTKAFNISFQDTDGDDIGVTYVVGPNRYGPYPPSRLADGMGPALDALEYTQRANRRE